MEHKLDDTVVSSILQELEALSQLEAHQKLSCPHALLIGSQAILYGESLPPGGRKPQDWDVICTAAFAKDWFASLLLWCPRLLVEGHVASYPIINATTAEGLSCHKKLRCLLTDDTRVELELPWIVSTSASSDDITTIQPTSSWDLLCMAEEFTELPPDRNAFSVPLKVAIPEILEMLKASHIYHPSHWLKHVSDMHLLRAALSGPLKAHGCEPTRSVFMREPDMDELLTKRRKETKDRLGDPTRNLNLQVSNEDFLEGDNLATIRKVQHDRLHEHVMYFQRPIYESLKTDPQSAMIDRDLFERAPFDIQLNNVREEAMAIALERFMIPRLETDPQAAYSNALRHVCTALSKGYWREFAINHWPLLHVLDRDLTEIYNGLEPELRQAEVDLRNKIERVKHEADKEIEKILYHIRPDSPLPNEAYHALPLDAFVTIAAYLQPVDTIALTLTCKYLAASLHSASLWLQSLRNLLGEVPKNLLEADANQARRFCRNLVRRYSNMAKAALLKTAQHSGSQSKVPNFIPHVAVDHKPRIGARYRKSDVNSAEYPAYTHLEVKNCFPEACCQVLAELHSVASADDRVKHLYNLNMAESSSSLEDITWSPLKRFDSKFARTRSGNFVSMLNVREIVRIQIVVREMNYRTTLRLCSEPETTETYSLEIFGNGECLLKVRRETGGEGSWEGDDGSYSFSAEPTQKILDQLGLSDVSPWELLDSIIRLNGCRFHSMGFAESWAQTIQRHAHNTHFLHFNDNGTKYPSRFGFPSELSNENPLFQRVYTPMCNIICMREEHRVIQRGDLSRLAFWCTKRSGSEETEVQQRDRDIAALKERDQLKGIEVIYLRTMDKHGAFILGHSSTLREIVLVSTKSDRVSSTKPSALAGIQKLVDDARMEYPNLYPNLNKVSEVILVRK